MYKLLPYLLTQLNTQYGRVHSNTSNEYIQRIRSVVLTYESTLIDKNERLFCHQNILTLANH